jgi:hypothetical protein
MHLKDLRRIVTSSIDALRLTAPMDSPSETIPYAFALRGFRAIEARKQVIDVAVVAAP